MSEAYSQIGGLEMWQRRGGSKTKAHLERRIWAGFIGRQRVFMLLRRDETALVLLKNGGGFAVIGDLVMKTARNNQRYLCGHVFGAWSSFFPEEDGSWRINTTVEEAVAVREAYGSLKKPKQNKPEKLRAANARPETIVKRGVVIDFASRRRALGEAKEKATA
jgi:hypothetical protein